MDNELRQQKVASGKEKLAAFRSKKSKTRKKSAAQCHSGHELAGDPKTSQHNIISDSFIDSEKSSVETTPSDALSLSDSEPYSMTSDDEQLDEASRRDCSSTHIPFTVSELENAMAEKKAVGDIFHIGDNAQRADMSLVELALLQRDDLLSQLASSLKCIQELPIQTDDFTAQLCVLAQHICMLKTKLNQANQDLQEQLILHESSMISLQSAKAQILQLQKIILKKDEHIISLTRATQANSDIGQAMKLKDDTINQCQMMLQSQSAQLDTYRRELEAKTVECQRRAAAHEEWAVKEHQLMNELIAKSEELLKLEEALQVVKLEESELHQKYALLQATIAEKDSSDRDVLRNLEHQLAELRATHESDSREISRLQKINHDLEVDLTDHSKRLSLVDSLQQDYEHIMNQHSGCLQQIDNLNIFNAEIQQRLYSLGHTENDLHVLKEQFNVLSLNYQKEVQLRSELKKMLLNLTTNDKTSLNADDIVRRVSSPYHENLNTNNSSSSTGKEAITTAVDISVIQKDVIVSSNNEDVYMQQKSGESVCVPDLENEKMHLLSLLEDLRSKLVNSDTVIQQYAEKISFLEKKNSSVKQMSKDEELKLLKTEIMSLTLKIQSQEADLFRATSELAESKESLLRLESKHSNSLDHTVHKNSENEEVNLLQLAQHHKEIAELQSHLESTVAQWQKLQFIVQEKEIEIQNLQENLDEQKRICSNMHSAHQEYVEVLQSEIDTLKLKLEDYQEKFFNMENEILNLITEKNSIHNELKQAYEHNGNNGKDSVDVEIQTNTSATYNLVDAEIQTFPPEVLTQASSIDTEFSNVESQTSLNKEKDLVDVEMQTNTSATCSLLDAETQTTPTEVLTQTTSTDNEIQIYGDATLPQQTEAENQTHGFNQTKPSTSQAISKDLKMNVPEESLVEQATMIDKLRETLSHKDLIINNLQIAIVDKEAHVQELQGKVNDIENELFTVKLDYKEIVNNFQLSEENLERKTCEIAAERKKASSQQLKLKASKKQAAQKDEAIADLNRKLLEYQEQILDLNSQLVDRKKENSSLLSENDEPEETSLLQGSVQTPNWSEQLWDKTTEIARLHAVIEGKEETLLNVNTLLSESNDNVSMLVKTIDEKEEELKGIHKAFLDQQSELSTLNDIVNEKNGAINNLNQKVSEMQVDIDNLQAVITDRDVQITDLENKLLEQENKVSYLLGRVHEKEEIVKCLNGQLSVSQEEIDKLHHLVFDKEQEISDFNRKLSELQNSADENMKQFQTEREEKLILCNQELRERSQEINSLKLVISEKEQNILLMMQNLETKELEVLSMDDKLKEQDVKMFDLNQVLAVKNEQVSQLQLHLSEPASELVEIRQRLGERDEDISKLNDVVAQRDEQLEKIHKILDEKSESVSELMVRISERDVMVSELQKDIMATDKEKSCLLEKLSEMENTNVNLQTLLSEKEVKLSEFTKIQTEKDEKIQNLQRMLSEKEVELSEFTNKQTEKDEEFQNLQRVLSEKEAELSEFTKNQTEKDEEIQNLQRMLSEKEVELSEFTNKQTEKDEEFQNLQRVLSEKEAELSEFTKNQTEKDEEIQNLQRMLSEKEVELSEFTKIQSEKDEEIQNLQRIISEKEVELSESIKKQTNKDEEIQSLQRVLSEKEVELSEFTKNQTEKDEEFQNLQRVLSDKEVEFSVFTKKQSEKDEEIQNLQRIISEKEVDLSESIKKQTNKDEEIQNLQLRLSDKDKQLSEHEEEILKLNETFRAKEEDCATLSQRLSDQAEEISKLNESVSNGKSRDFELNTFLYKKDEDISGLQEKMSEKDQQIVVLEEKMLNIEGENKNLMRKLEEKVEDLSQVHTKTNEIMDELVALRRQTTEKDLEMMDIRTKLEEVKKEISKLNDLLGEKEQHIVCLSERAEEQELALVILQNNAIDKDEEIIKLQSTLRDTTMKVSVLQKCLDNTMQEKSILQKNKENITEDNIKLQKEVENKDSSLIIAQTQLKSESEMNLESTKLLNTKDAEILKLKVIVSELVEDKANLHEQLAALNKDSGLLGQKEEEIKTMLTRLVEKDEELANVNQMILDKEKVISDMKEAIDFKEEELSQANRNLVLKNEEIVMLTQLVQEQTESCQVKISAAQQQLADNDSVTENYKIRLSELEVLHKQTLEKLMQKEGQLDMFQSELETKKQEIQVSNLKFEELICSNRDLSESIVSLNHKLETCLSNLYEKEAELCQAQHELSEKEMVIESTFLERDSLSEQLLQQKIILNELEDKVGSLESEISIQKLHRDDVVKEMEVKHIVVCDELKGLKSALQKKDAEYSIVEQDRDITNSKLLELETELLILKKELEDSNLEKQSSKENLLQNLTEMQQKIIQKDLEIAEITNKLSQEEENCRLLMSSNSNLQRNLVHLKSCLSNLSEKSEENQSVMIEQEVRLLEQERKIENLLANNVLGSSPEQAAYSSEDHSKIAAPEKKSDTIAVDILTRNDRYLHLMNQFIILRQDTEAKDQLLLEQKLQIEHQSINVSNLTEDLQKLQITLSESIQSNTSLKAETDALKAQCQSLTELEHTWKQRISSLETEVESLENISSHHVSECNRLAENVAQLSQERDLKEQQHIKVTHEAENYTKELNDIKVELEHKSVTESNLKETIVALTSSLDKSQEERELLKANFDSCMEDMQHKLAQQDLEIQSLRSKLAEQAKTVGQGQDQLKDMFELQICQLEEKLLLSEKQGEQLAKELEDSKAKFASSKDLFESQLSDLEISFQSSNSEAAKLRDQLSKIMINHECEIAGLKRLHDIQANELEDSCIALERNVSELKRQINDQTIKFNKERSNLEQSLEFQLSDNEEKRRIYETEISRLKRHLEEMKHDHEMELRNVEKSCEARMYELEDKCCIASNELERLRKSFIADGEYPEEQHRLDLRVDELETKRRDLEILNMSLEDEVRHLREQMAMREEELKSVLHSMAEKESERNTECAEEIISLRHQVSELSLEKKQILESLQKKKIDLEHVITKNKDLQLKIAELEQFVEEAVKSRKDWDNDGRTTLPSVEDLRSRINSLSEENSSLKRQLSVQEIPRCKLHLNSGVETICPPYSHASTEYSKSSVTDECFSPVVEPEVLEGFVAEKTISINGSSNTNTNSMINQEPDFVEEKNDRFQPEVESERFMDSSNQLNMHPIWENEIHEGFQPEMSDLFLIESAEETTQRIAWPNELSVGMSPSHHQPDESQFDFNLTGEQGQTPHLNKTEEKLSASKEVDACDDGGNANEKMTVNEKQMNQMMEDLEEQYVMKLRKQESDLQFKYEAQCEQFKKETEQHFAQKVQAVRYEWERKFTKALRKLKRDMDLRHREHTQELKGRASDQTDARLSSMPDIAERNEELGEVVEKLHKENQELAEVRDDLLRQIEMSRARGLRDRVQHELQTMLTTRDSHSLEVSRSRELHDRVLQELQTVMTPGDVHSLATVPTPCAISPPVSYEDGTLVKQSVDEAESSKSEGSDSSSVRESFLEELEEISHQSGQDLPLEWELTSTETGAFEQEPASIWEVFDGRCARQDCQEVRHKFHKLYQWVVNQGVDMALCELNLLLGDPLGNNGALKNESIDPSLSKTEDNVSLNSNILLDPHHPAIGLDNYSNREKKLEVKSIYDEILEQTALEVSQPSTVESVSDIQDIALNKENNGSSCLSGFVSEDTDSEVFNLSSDKLLDTNESLIALDDQTLADELNLLRKDLVDTKAIYFKENALFQKALLKDQLGKEKVMSKAPSDQQLELKELHVSQTTAETVHPTDEDEITKHKFSICMEQISMLEEENSSLRSRLRKQEAMTVHLKFQLQQKDQDVIEWQKTFSHHLTALQKQRSDLIQQLEDKESGKQPYISKEFLEAQKSDSVIQVQEELMVKIEELDHLYKMLTLRQIELQHCEAERRHLEQMCLLKDLTEIQLMKQKRMMEEHISDIELRLHDREAMLREDKNRLLQEIKDHDIKLFDMSHAPADINPLVKTSMTGQTKGNLNPPPSTSKTKFDESDTNRQHIKAIEVLRSKLLKEYELQAAKTDKSNQDNSSNS
uniref:Pericentrin/AKAP-450 centrosomal targeting domain-containing protein n=1 Tax=Biomphalaria glabrata TaxID=6526 RepID=A0A2C9M011_BIOGL